MAERKQAWVAVAAAVATIAVTGVTIAVTKSGSGGVSQNASGTSAHDAALAAMAKLDPRSVVKTSAGNIASKASAKVSMTMGTSAMTMSAGGVIRFGTDTAMDVTTSVKTTQGTNPLAAFGGSLRELLTGGVIYMNTGRQMAAQLNGKQWMSIDLGEISSVPGLANLSFLKDALKNTDPSQKLDTMTASGDLKVVGTEDVAGVQEIHYAGDITSADIAKLTAGAVSGLTAADLDAMKASLATSGVTSIHQDLWITADGLPAEVKMVEPSKAGDITIDAKYSAWGTPVAVTAPPADQTVDLVKLMQSQGQSPTQSPTTAQS